MAEKSLLDALFKKKSNLQYKKSLDPLVSNCWPAIVKINKWVRKTSFFYTWSLKYRVMTFFEKSPCDFETLWWTTFMLKIKKILKAVSKNNWWLTTNYELTTNYGRDLIGPFPIEGPGSKIKSTLAKTISNMIIWVFVGKRYSNFQLKQEMYFLKDLIL